MCINRTIKLVRSRVTNPTPLLYVVGHLSSVRDVYVPDNEHYFLSASRDKTVKLWLLKNHGNGTAQLGCSKTYDNHTKSVFAIQAVESKRLVASCDGSVHVSVLPIAIYRYVSVNVLRSLREGPSFGLRLEASKVSQNSTKFWPHHRH